MTRTIRNFVFFAVISGAFSFAADSYRQSMSGDLQQGDDVTIATGSDGLEYSANKVSDPSEVFQANDSVSSRWQIKRVASFGSSSSATPVVTNTKLDALAPISFDREKSDFGSEPEPAIRNVSDQSGQATWRPLDTLSLFGGLEGSKQPQDFGVNANFGSRWAANWGFPLLAEYGIGAQLGTSINHTDNAVQVFDRVGATSDRTQSFSTVGVFQRINQWRWGAGYDFLYESYYDNFFLGQWRARGGYAVSNKDEFGVWFTVSQHHDSGMFLTTPVTLTPLDQGSIYWQHLFSTGARTMFWMGVSEGHAQANLALGDLKKTGDQFVFGAEIDVPLNQYFALYGQANFISPADSGTVDSYMGVAFYPGGHAFPAMRNPFTPLLSLANSTMFATNLSR